MYSRDNAVHSGLSTLRSGLRTQSDSSTHKCLMLLKFSMVANHCTHVFLGGDLTFLRGDLTSG